MIKERRPADNQIRLNLAADRYCECFGLYRPQVKNVRLGRGYI